jgi:DNA-binding beta-propeller fold protein YncE
MAHPNNFAAREKASMILGAILWTLIRSDSMLWVLHQATKPRERSFVISYENPLHKVSVAMALGGLLKQVTAGVAAALCTVGAAWAAPSAATIALPGGEHGIGLDDMVYSPELQRVIIPAGRTGNLVLLAPADGTLTVIHTRESPATTGQGKGITSAAVGLGYLFAGDRSAARIVIIDPRTNTVLARQKLAAEPDYVRFSVSLRELWVTEPGAEQIEVFRVHTDAVPRLEPAGVIPVPGGPESLVIDDRRSVAYTNLWSNETLAVGLVGHRVVSHWRNTCEKSRGLALAVRTGLLFVGCKEGKAVSMDPGDNGAVLSTADAGSGVDIIAFDPGTNRLYVPGADSGTVTVFSVAPSGRLAPAAVYPAAAGAHCVVTDDNGTAYVCDPRRGRLLVIPPRAAGGAAGINQGGA